MPCRRHPAAHRGRRLRLQGAALTDTHTGVTLSGLLNALDGVSSRDGRVLFLTTNHPERLDPALIRPGRVDRKVELGLATPDQARRLFLWFYRGCGIGPSELGPAERFAAQVRPGKSGWRRSRSSSSATAAIPRSPPTRPSSATGPPGRGAPPRSRGGIRRTLLEGLSLADRPLLALPPPSNLEPTKPGVVATHHRGPLLGRGLRGPPRTRCYLSPGLSSAPLLKERCDSTCD